jgi:hypothetical protein
MKFSCHFYFYFFVSVICEIFIRSSAMAAPCVCPFYQKAKMFDVLVEKGVILVAPGGDTPETMGGKAGDMWEVWGTGCGCCNRKLVALEKSEDLLLPDTLAKI